MSLSSCCRHNPAVPPPLSFLYFRRITRGEDLIKAGQEIRRGGSGVKNKIILAACMPLCCFAAAYFRL
jgi:hypothetical protein